MTTVSPGQPPEGLDEAGAVPLRVGDDVRNNLGTEATEVAYVHPEVVTVAHEVLDALG